MILWLESLVFFRVICYLFICYLFLCFLLKKYSVVVKIEGVMGVESVVLDKEC